MENWGLVAMMILGITIGLATAWAISASRRSDDLHEAVASELAADTDLVSVLSVLPQGVILVDAEDDVIRASSSAFGQGLVRNDRLVHPEIQDVLDELRSDGEIKDVEFELPRGPVEGAGTMALSVRLAPLTQERVLILTEDRTKALRVEAMRRDFVANVSHELKTPVGALGLLAETIGDAADDPETVKRFAVRIERESKRLSKLVQEIIDLSRLQEPDALASASLVSIDEVITEATDRIRVQADDKNVSVHTGGDKGSYVFGDHSLLTTAVRNVVDNAVRYSPAGSRVSVGVSQNDGLVRIAVVDNGHGIEAELRERIFERFFRGDQARSRETGGSGLGLSIVKHVAADHGGRVELWSTPGAGSTFTLVIPAAEDRSGAEENFARPAPRIKTRPQTMTSTGSGAARKDTPS